MTLRYQKEIDEIKAGLRDLFGRVAENVHRAMDAVLYADGAKASEVMKAEQQINHLEVSLEEACIRVMTLHQPVADDLRFLVATIKVNHDLERIGDLAMGIAKRVRTLTPEHVQRFSAPLEQLIQDLKKRLQDAAESFFQRNQSQATLLWIGDDVIDQQASALCADIRQTILDHPQESRPLFTLLSIVQRMERLADHAANIAKNVIFLSLGEIVRHRMGEFRKKIGENRPGVLLVCVHNSARSQMAAAWINHLYGHRMQAESAGLTPGVLNPLAVQAMAEVGIDISRAGTRDVFEVMKTGHPFSQIITVCDEASAEKCPPFPGVENVLHWDLPDPAAAQGTEEEKMKTFREVRDALRLRVDQWMDFLSS